MSGIITALLQSILSIVVCQATIVFAGDAMQHEAQIKAAHRGGDVYDYSGCFDSIAVYVSDADYAVVNLETPLGGKPYAGYPCFCAPDEFAKALKDAGFDMCLTANNHTLDRRDKGLIRTVAVLDSMGLDHIGTYVNASRRDSILPFIKEINGFKVGFLNYTYGTNGIPVTGNVVVDMIDRNVIDRDIKEVRASGAELVAVAMHWGAEYVMSPGKEQRQLVDFLVDRGVDMIIGGHPHVVQPIEMCRNEKTGKRVLVVYSLGNFISNMKTRDTRGGAMVKVTLTRDSLGNAVVGDAEYSLVFTEAPRKNGENFRLLPVEKVTGEWKPACEAFRKRAEAVMGPSERISDSEVEGK